MNLKKRESTLFFFFFFMQKEYIWPVWNRFLKTILHLARNLLNRPPDCFFTLSLVYRSFFFMNLQLSTEQSKKWTSKTKSYILPSEKKRSPYYCIRKKKYRFVVSQIVWKQKNLIEWKIAVTRINLPKISILIFWINLLKITASVDSRTALFELFLLAPI